MKLATTPQEFHSASLQLLRAFPASTRITTTYHASSPGKGVLTLKTFDPVSGAVIKFRTTKIAQVGRIVAELHRLARVQTDVMGDVTAEGGDSPATAATTAMTALPAMAATIATAAATTATTGAKGATGATGAKGKGKKKKGKKP